MWEFPAIMGELSKNMLNTEGNLVRALVSPPSHKGYYARRKKILKRRRVVQEERGPRQQRGEEKRALVIEGREMPCESRKESQPDQNRRGKKN